MRFALRLKAKKATSQIFMVLVLIATVISCATSPRGRKQLLLLPENQLDAMGIQAFSDMQKQTPVTKDPALNAYVHCVTEPLTAQVKDLAPKGNWEILVFKDDSQINAFALPGGKIGVYTGLFKVTDNADQLATVIGHEIGHVIARHGNERVSETLATQGGLAALGTILNEKGSSYNLVMSALGVGAQYGILLPHSRAQESEADLIGLELMAKAGFDPRQSVNLWKNMSAQAGGQEPPEFLSTHPANATRIANLQKTVPEVMGLYEKSPTHPKCGMSPATPLKPATGG